MEANKNKSWCAEDTLGRWPDPVIPECNERVLDVENMHSNMSVWNTYGSELAGDFGMKACGQPVVWGGKCIIHKVERRKVERRSDHKGADVDQGNGETMKAATQPPKCPTCGSTRIDLRGDVRGSNDQYYLCRDPWHDVVESQPVVSGTQEDLDTLVRDLTAVGPHPKSEVRRRIEAYASQRAAASRLVNIVQANQLIKAEAELTRLREALRKYGAHRDNCMARPNCSCGFAALAEREMRRVVNETTDRANRE